MPPSRFNIRVYGIWIHEGQLLVNEELIRGRHILKLPGGGLELGEGTLDGLKREWMEELGLEIEVLEHFYTTDFFQQSAFDDSQVISIYYRVTANPELPIQNIEVNERTYWLPLTELNEDTFTLPIDRMVGGMLLWDGTDRPAR
jgi:ADP-ribose pyrophosphatase YjhB (NUDIX family)